MDPAIKKKVLRKFTWNGEKFVEQRDAAPN